MKYRILNTDELKELENEFINFLIVNSITADDWVIIKEKKTAQAEEMIELFSDMVLDKVLQKIRYLEHRSDDSIMLFRCDSDKMLLIGLKVEASIGLDSVIKDPSLLSENSVRIFMQEKKYLKQREEELFEMTEQGCYITDEKLFNILLEIKN